MKKNEKQSTIIMITLGILLGISCIGNVLLGTIGKNRIGTLEKPTPVPTTTPTTGKKYSTPIVRNVMATKHSGITFRIITEDYDGEYDKEIIHYENDDFETNKILSYEEYEEYCKKYNINQKYTEKEKYPYFIVYANQSLKEGFRFANYDTQYTGSLKRTWYLYIWKNCDNKNSKNKAGVLIIPIQREFDNNIEIVDLYTQEEFDDIKESEYDIDIIDDKPVIYIYPEKEQEVEVKLLNDDRLLHSYPKYENSWKVIASPNGNLKEKNRNRNYYALYYESKTNNIKETEEGFIVEKENITKFLEEKLEILGLNEKEQEEFIIYWLPRLEQNKYVYIRFANKEEIEENMKLEINPKPKTLIRVMMVWKGLNEKKEVKEQKLQKIKRKGYTVVEWGGVELKGDTYE